MIDGVSINLSREDAITAAELNRDQARELSVALRQVTNEKHELQRQYDRLREENVSLARRVGKLTVLRQSNADTVLAVALHRKDLRAAFRNPEAVTIVTRAEDFEEGFKPHHVSLDDVLSDGLWTTFLAWITDVLNGGSITINDNEVRR